MYGWWRVIGIFIYIDSFCIISICKKNQYDYKIGQCTNEFKARISPVLNLSFSAKTTHPKLNMQSIPVPSGRITYKITARCISDHKPGAWPVIFSENDTSQIEYAKYSDAISEIYFVFSKNNSSHNEYSFYHTATLHIYIYIKNRYKPGAQTWCSISCFQQKRHII